MLNSIPFSFSNKESWSKIPHVMFSGFIDNLVGLSILLRHDGIKENHSLAALRISRYSSDKTPNWVVLLPFSDKIKKTLPIIFVLYYNYLFFLRRVSFIICFRTTLLFKTKNAPKVLMCTQKTGHINI